jgi:hypothetical protein
MANLEPAAAIYYPLNQKKLDFQPVHASRSPILENIAPFVSMT